VEGARLKKIFERGLHMKKTILVKLAVLLLATSTLSGCLWMVEDDGYRRGGHSQQRDHDERGDRRGESHGERR
jgi:hypothetical protein